MVLECVCKSAFQDQRYGPGRRYHNQKKTTQSMPPIYRCTVCGTERSKTKVAKVK